MSWTGTVGAGAAKKAEPRPTGPIYTHANPGDYEHYARAAFDREVARVTNAVEGERNVALNTAAFCLGQLVGAGVLTESTVIDALTAVALQCGLEQTETRKTIASGIESGKKEPRDMPEPKAKSNGSSNGAIPPDDYEYTDDDAPDAPPDNDPQHSEDSEPLRSVGLTIADVFDQWRTEGPLVHEPTGIPKLDEHTAGGPVYGTRWFEIGAPDAGKTGLFLQIGHNMAKRGVCVGFVAVDEEPGDLLTRFVQRSGWKRRDCETRFPDALNAMQRELESLPIRFYNDVTIEQAAADLAAFAKEQANSARPRACLVVDSLQTVECAAEAMAREAGRELSTRDQVTERARAVRAVASRHRLIALCTSEMNRSGYRTKEAAESADDKATAAESRAVEYQGRVVIALRSVAGETDLVEIRIPKNKHRPAGVDPDERLYLRLDRASQTFAPAEYVPKPEADRDEKRRDKANDAAAKVARLILDNPGVTVRQLRIKARATAGLSHDRCDEAVIVLGEAIEIRDGKRNAHHMTLNLDMVPTVVRTLMEVEK